MSSQQKKQTILVVDDMPDNISLLSGILSKEYRIKASNNGADALELARKTPPALSCWM